MTERLHGDKRILLVDDDPFNLQSLRIIVEMAIKQLKLPLDAIRRLIDTATDGLEAQEIVRRRWQEDNKQFGLILSDCQMPNCNGYVATQKIREFVIANDLSQPVIVACTGNVEQGQIEMAFSSHFDEVVAKPVSLKTIVEILKEVIII